MIVVHKLDADSIDRLVRGISMIFVLSWFLVYLVPTWSRARREAGRRRADAWRPIVERLYPPTPPTRKDERR